MLEGKKKCPPIKESTPNLLPKTGGIFLRLLFSSVRDCKTKTAGCDLTYGKIFAKYSNDCCFGFSPNSQLPEQIPIKSPLSASEPQPTAYTSLSEDMRIFSILYYFNSQNATLCRPWYPQRQLSFP